MVILECNINLGATGPRHRLTMIPLTSLIPSRPTLRGHCASNISLQVLSLLTAAGKDLVTEECLVKTLHWHSQSDVYCSAGSRPEWNSVLLPSYSQWVHVQTSEFLPAASELLFLFLLSHIIPTTGAQRFTLIPLSTHATVIWSKGYKWKPAKAQNTVEVSPYKNSPVISSSQL